MTALIFYIALGTILWVVVLGLTWDFVTRRLDKRRQRRAAATREANRAKQEADARKWGLSPLELPCERNTRDQAGTLRLVRDRRGIAP